VDHGLIAKRTKPTKLTKENTSQTLSILPGVLRAFVAFVMSRDSYFEKRFATACQFSVFHHAPQ
jgi:type III secretory pathway lipoprotein EscJ